MNILKAVMAVSLMLSAPMAWAHGDEGHGDMQQMQGMEQMSSMASMPTVKQGMFMKKKAIGGYEVSFHIMKAPEGGKKHGGSHHVMVKVEKDGKVVTLQAMNSKVQHPNQQSESKMMMKMGDWYMAAYDLDHAGQHKVMVLFKTKNGDKHFGGVVYQEQ